MLILCSNGLSSENLLKNVEARIGISKSAALVVTADNEYKEKNYHVCRCIKELKSLELSVDIIDVDIQPFELLLNYEVVEFIGGNPFYLLNSIRENNGINILRRIARDKILIGWSAAAFVFGPTLELVNMYSPELNFLKIEDLNGVGLTSVEVLPHYSKFKSRFDNFEERCFEYEKTRNKKVIRLDDGDGIIFDDDKMIICRG